MIAFVVLLMVGASVRQEPTPEQPVRVSGTVSEPKKVRDASPSYPEDARRAGLGGMVILECTIGIDGHVTDVKPLKGAPPLVAAAVPAVRKWRYSQTRLDGKPVPIIITVTVNFRHDRRVRLSELIDSLSHNDEFIREAAARTIGRLGIQAADAVPALIRATADDRERVRAAASEALARVRGK